MLAIVEKPADVFDTFFSSDSSPCLVPPIRDGETPSSAITPVVFSSIVKGAEENVVPTGTPLPVEVAAPKKDAENDVMGGGMEPNGTSEEEEVGSRFAPTSSCPVITGGTTADDDGRGGELDKPKVVVVVGRGSG